MALSDDLKLTTKRIFSEPWEQVDARVVPETKSMALKNAGKKLNATVLYADLDGSTSLVDNYKPEFAAEVYRSFLYCSSRIIRANGGEIRSFDGDRVMGVFLGDTKNTSAVKSGLQINYAVKNIINPALKAQYASTKYVVRHTVGIDSSTMMAVRAGVRSSNDISWIGRAANYAAKLNSLSSDFPTRITESVFENMNESAKLGGEPRRSMWQRRIWTDVNQMTIYRSSWTWKTG